MIITRSRAGRAAAAAAVGLLAVACSSGDDAATSTTSAAAPSTTAPPDATTSTTAAPAPAADDESIALAVAGSIQLADVGEPWVVYEEGTIVESTDTLCVIDEDDPVAALGVGAIQAGPYLQYGTEEVWVQSTSFAFDDVEDAQGWIDTVNSDAWVDCQVERQQQHQDDQDMGVDVTVQTRTHDDLGVGGLESYLELTPELPDGTSRAVFVFAFYRLDHVVIEIATSVGQAEDAVHESSSDDAYDALLSVYDRVNALLAASPDTTTTANAAG